MAINTINHSTLSRLVEAGAVRGAHIVGQPGGWAVIMRYGMHECPLVTKNTRTVRVWRRFETLASYLKGIGLTQFDVDATNFYHNTTTTIKRPDRAKALKKTHEAAAYDKWFREQVQASIDDPRPSLTDAEANAHMETFLVALEKEAHH